MDWHFCPHCETQLDAETFICPACRWDPLATPETTGAAAASTSMMERYRGTQYDMGWNSAATSVDASPPVSRTAHRVRTIVMVAFLAIIGMYGTMLMYTDFESHRDQPAAAFGARR